MSHPAAARDAPRGIRTVTPSITREAEKHSETWYMIISAIKSNRVVSTRVGILGEFENSWMKRGCNCDEH